MPGPDLALPYGLRSVVITPYTTGETLGTALKLPNSQTFSFSESEDFEQLRGDDGVVTTRGKGPAIEWDLAAGGVSISIVKAMYGGTVVTTGVTPGQKTTFTKLGLDSRPFFKVEGQAISDSGGDVHVTLSKCRCTKDLKGEFADGNFFIYGASGIAIPKSADNVLWTMTENETATAIPVV